MTAAGESVIRHAVPLVERRGTCTIGTAGADVLLPRSTYPHVARQQLQVFFAEDRVMIQNLSPTTPCRIDETELGQCDLDWGTHMLEIGNDAFELSLELE